MPPDHSRPVLITGCSSGIGRAAADALRSRGFRVFATARREDDAEALRAAGYDSLQLDLADSESIHRAVEEIGRRTHRHLYGLVNNGAFGQPGAVEDLRRDVLRDQFETNVFGTHELTTLVLPWMRARGEGRIVQISSLLGVVCLAYRGAYNASKYALEALSDTLRLELQGTGIHISLIEPGAIRTRFRDHALAAFRANIDAGGSAHRERYAALLSRLEGQAGPMPFTLPPTAVAAKVAAALESTRPRIRYPVTVPAHLAWWLRRMLSHRALDWVLLRVGGEGRR